jgi:hypothetical protein
LEKTKYKDHLYGDEEKKKENYFCSVTDEPFRRNLSVISCNARRILEDSIFDLLPHDAVNDFSKLGFNAGGGEKTDFYSSINFHEG